MHKAQSLTAALEDYLEAILNLSRLDQAARSRDIAEALNVHKSTVTAALKSLGQLNLINYSPYEAVTLTPAGRQIAEDVASRHATLKDFFIDVLKVDAATAETAACGMEHAVPRVIIEKLALFARSMRECPRLAVADSAQTAGCGACDGTPASTDAPPASTTLDTVAPGETVKILSVTGGGPVRQRLTEMGLTRGSMVTVERVAPMGDPMDIRLRGYRLSLRKEEAGLVVVGPIERPTATGAKTDRA
ncbi:MAG: DtxR family transcriptional regulator [Planctomycetes bacterium]|nr:DtxR family transcriptional regulator [Planctomycetota bacterium]